MATYAQNEALLAQMQALSTPGKQAAEINELSNDLKGFVLQSAIGMYAMPADFDKLNLHLDEGSLGQEFENNGNGVKLLIRLRHAVNTYNAALGKETLKIPVKNSVLETDPSMTMALYSNLSFLNSINQVQMYLALAESNKAVAIK